MMEAVGPRKTKAVAADGGIDHLERARKAQVASIELLGSEDIVEERTGLMEQAATIETSVRSAFNAADVGHADRAV